MPFFLSSYKPIEEKSRLVLQKVSKVKKLSGKFIDSDFLFDNHMTDLCRKTSQKTQAPFKVASYMH